MPAVVTRSNAWWSNAWWTLLITSVLRYSQEVGVGRCTLDQLSTTTPQCFSHSHPPARHQPLARPLHQPLPQPLGRSTSHPTAASATCFIQPLTRQLTRPLDNSLDHSCSLDHCNSLPRPLPRPPPQLQHPIGHGLLTLYCTGLSINVVVLYGV